MKKSLLLLSLTFGIVFSHTLSASAASAASEQPERPVQTNPLAPNFVIMGNEALSLGEIELALNFFNQAIEADPNYAQGYYMRGLVIANHQSFKDALPDYNRALELDPTFAQGFISRGTAYRQLGDYDKAFADYERSLILDPNNVTAHYARGLAWLAVGDQDEAYMDFDAAASRKPDFAQAFYQRGKILFLKGSNQRALNDFNQALKHAPNDLEFLDTRANAFLMLQRFAEARQDVDSLLKRSPDSVMGLHTLGMIQLHQNEVEPALKTFERAVKLAPTDSRLQLGKAMALGQLKRNPEAILALNEAIRLDPKFATSYFIRGALHYSLGHCEESRQDLEQACSLGHAQACSIPKITCSD